MYQQILNNHRIKTGLPADIKLGSIDHIRDKCIQAKLHLFW